MAVYKESGSNLDKCLSDLRISHASRLTSKESGYSEYLITLYLMKARFTVLSLFESPFEDLTKSEYKVLRHFYENKYIVIQRADKGSFIMLLEKTFYLSCNLRNFK